MKIHGVSRGGAGARRGGALVLSLVAVSTVVVLAASFSRFASSVANRQAQAVNRKRSFYMAEAGLAEAFAGLTCGKSGVVGSILAPARLGDGLFWVEVTELDADVLRLDSTGMVGTGSTKLSLIARRGVQDIAALGVFSSGGVALGAGSLVDAYDSTKGTYAAQTDHNGAALGSNGAITVTGSLAKPSIVKGDVTPGPNQTVTTSGSVSINGSTQPALIATDLPAVTSPELVLGPAQVHGSPYPLVIPAGAIGYESLTVQTGAQVIIEGPAQVVLGTLALQDQAELSFDTDLGPVELYVSDALDLATGSFVTTSGTRPEDVLVQVPSTTAQPVKLQATGPFHGVVYAPEATVTVGASFEMFGALVAGQLAFDAGAKLHFDLNLGRLASDSAIPKVLSWRLVELSSTSADLSADPFDLLGLDEEVLPPPSSAHADQTLAIDYYDSSSVYHRYIGLESQFDWTVVQSVISATRDGVQVVFPRSNAMHVGTTKSPGVAPVVDGPMI